MSCRHRVTARKIHKNHVNQTLMRKRTCMNESNVPRESDRIRYKFLGLILSAMFATLATSGCCRCPGNAADSRESPRPEAVSGPAAAVQTTTYHSIGVVKSTNVKLSSIG